MTGVRTNLFFVALALSLFGVVMVYSATYRFSGTGILIVRLVHLALGIAVFAVVSRGRYTVWRRYASVLYAVVLVGLILVLVPGVGLEVNGSRRWLDAGFMNLQPSEFAKIAGVVYLSCALARLKPGSASYARVVGDAADSPIVRRFGSENQFSFGASISYSFTTSGW